MALIDDFELAQTEVKQLKATPAPNELLTLYAFFKQATVGDVSGARPGMLDFKGRAKFDAWEQKKGQSKDACMQGYVDFVAELKRRYA
ncbi:MAG: acyl-CoA-binding protein [Polyangiaceae bacterium]|nr:acyl-CoA-binding protein [Polyangiaceae bacterium]